MPIRWYPELFPRTDGSSCRHASAASEVGEPLWSTWILGRLPAEAPYLAPEFAPATPVRLHPSGSAMPKWKRLSVTFLNPAGSLAPPGFAPSSPPPLPASFEGVFASSEELGVALADGVLLPLSSSAPSSFALPSCALSSSAL